MRTQLSWFAVWAIFTMLVVSCGSDENACERACNKINQCLEYQYCEGVTGACIDEGLELSNCINATSCDNMAVCIDVVL